MEFSEKFNTYSNVDLLRIIENPNDYQPQAVETAKTIFSERQLSEMEIKIAENELENERQQKLKKEQNKLIVEEKVKNIGNSIFDLINPIQKKTPTPEKSIKIISIIFGGLFLFQLYKEFGMLRFMFTDSYAEWGFDMVLYFLPLIIIPTATILFYMRKKTGWLLLTMFLTYSAVLTIGMIILTMNMKPSGIEVLDNIFPQTPLLTYILVFLFYTGIIWAISREKIRIIYSINKLTMTLTISIVTLVVALGIIVIFAWL